MDVDSGCGQWRSMDVDSESGDSGSGHQWVQTVNGSVDVTVKKVSGCEQWKAQRMWTVKKA